MAASEDLAGLFDPGELRARLDVALQQVAYLHTEHARLETENARLRSLLAPGIRADGQIALPLPDLAPLSSPPGSPAPAGVGGLPYANGASNSADKIALFRALFTGREDVYPRRWVSRAGKTGWSPAEADQFNHNKAEEDRVFFRLTDKVVYSHLDQSEPPPGKTRRETHIGLYPMLADDTCQLLACDFDGKNGQDWRGDAAAYAAACREAGLWPLTEISRSGAGAHVWLFFTAPVPAARARALGMGLLRQAIAVRGQMGLRQVTVGRSQKKVILSSYDRLFPAQDFLPVNSKPNFRFGSLIALPLHGASRAKGTTIFADPVTWEVYGDQFAHLSQTQRLTPDQVTEIADRLGEVETGAAVASLGPRPRRGELGKAPAQVPARLSAMLEIATAGLSPQLLAALKHAASFHNPEFFERQRTRRSTWDVERLVCRFDATDPDWLKIPRGLTDQATSLIAAAGGKLEIISEPPKLQPVTIRFTGTLRATQEKALKAMAPHRSGILTAPAGAGKTVMGCALIAERGVPAVVIVNRKHLMSQWREKIGQFLDLGEGEAGSLGDGKDSRKHVLDVVILQSLYESEDPAALLDGYGLAIVDECQTVGAPAAVKAIGAARIPAWVGLSATPYRSDKMDPLITMYCGPVRHEMEDVSTFARHLIIHPTAFTTTETGKGLPSSQAIYNELAVDADRNKLIAADIADAARRQRCSLTLTNRVEHLHQLAAALKPHGITPLFLHGGMKPAEQAEVRAALSGPPRGPQVLLAIDKLAGQGFDAPLLDTLFIAAPVKFKGTNIQYVGRITRNTEERKSHVEAHDYLDADVPWLARMHRQRRRVLEGRHFTVVDADSLPATPPPPVPAPVEPESREHRPPAPKTPAPEAAQVRAWAREQGMDVPKRGKLRADIWAAWAAAHA